MFSRLSTNLTVDIFSCSEDLYITSCASPVLQFILSRVSIMSSICDVLK
jgi:hypothetical protein